MTITLKEIAEKAGVSKPVVSAVLNNRSRNSRVSAATRERIERIARENHYLPNAAAQNLARRETRTVHVVIPSFKLFEVQQYTQLVNSLQAYLLDNGYMLQVTSLEYSFRNQKLLQAIDTDGLVLFYWGGKEELIAQLRQLEKPMVIVNAEYEGDDISSVSVDDYHAMYDLTRKVIAAGHRSIVYVDSFSMDVTHKAMREGMQAAAAEHAGVTVNRVEATYDEVLPGNPEEGISMGSMGMELALKQTPRPTVVMYNSDLIAHAGVKAAVKMGLRIPEDISITGAQDHRINETSLYPLATTSNAVWEAGQEAAKLILSNIRNKTDEPEKIKVTSRAVLRGSLGTI